jgi:hypothetical protein
MYESVNKLAKPGIIERKVITACFSNPLYCLLVMDENLLASGDDNGTVKCEFKHCCLCKQDMKHIFQIEVNIPIQ